MKNLAKETRNTYIPFTDICEIDNTYSLVMEMPGVLKENIEIEIDEDELRVFGKITEKVETKDLKYSEYTKKDFYRAFNIGHDIDRNKMEAELENGVLTLTLHKCEKAKPKKITIN